MTLIDAEKLTDEYYLRHMSLALKDGLGIPERIKIYCETLRTLEKVGTDLFEWLNVFYYKPGEDWFDHVAGDDAEELRESDECYWLDLVGDIYGISRSVADTSFGSITLNNADFLIYIVATAAKTTYDGRRKTLRKIYTGSEIYLYNNYTEDVPEYIRATFVPSALTSLGIYYAEGSQPLTCKIVLPYKASYSENLVKLFKAGYLTVESMGISYERLYTNGFEEGEYSNTVYDHDGTYTTTVYGEG